MNENYIVPYNALAFLHTNTHIDIFLYRCPSRGSQLCLEIILPFCCELFLCKVSPWNPCFRPAFPSAVLIAFSTIIFHHL